MYQTNISANFYQDLYTEMAPLGPNEFIQIH